MPEHAQKGMESILDDFKKVEGFVFDMDGTLVLGDKTSNQLKPLPGALDMICGLKARGIPYVVFTNGTAHPPETYFGMLSGAGFPLVPEQMLTPSSVAADFFAARKTGPVLVLGNEGVWKPLKDAGLRVILPGDPLDGVEAVYVGWFREFTLPDLEAACEAVWAGAKLYTASNVPFFATAKGRAFGTSFAINAMIKAMTGARARVLGKPSVDAVKAAARRLGVPASRLAVVGDDPLLEMAMAKRAGALAIAVTTGINDRAAFEAQPVRQQADVILSGVHELVPHLPD